MANGKGALLQLVGKVSSGNGLVVVGQAVSVGTGPATTLANQVCAVDASNRLIVTFG